MTGNPLFARLPERLQWAPHNIVGHPLSEIAYQIGMLRGPSSRMFRLSDWLHDWTVPAHPAGAGRG